ncbi:IclR family transcriptional regulator [Pseudonocardia kujensis]|uniref:IclR family transcriptional regulator n=1 Tax=Pseudonocardia kujensis TaxID=1128675 RepID=UPI001E4194C3|nr:IclR family transcriptional regulator [Pseudonocardia kujensis]MCE0765769.1 IclR family transcriptional regulator [Pseudonocardia kujensis]
MANLQTIQKIGPILDLFTAECPEWGVREVAATVGIPRSTAHSVMASLVETGLLQCRARGRYRIGWRVVELSEALRGTIDVRSCAAPHLDRLVETHGETCHLAVLERGRILYVDKLLGTHNISVRGANVGARLEAHSTAVGKVLLAQLEHAELSRMIDGAPLRRHTATTVTDPTALRATLRQVRGTGYAVDLGETIPEVHCVAAPVRDEMGSVVAAVSVSVPASRFRARRAELTRAVVETARGVSRDLVDAAAPQPASALPAAVVGLERTAS